jgi:hypothetical protein
MPECCDSTGVPLTNIGVAGPPLPAPLCPPPCAAPPILGHEPVEIVLLCKPDGSPVGLVYAPGEANNVPCPPVAGSPAMPGYLGWVDLTLAPGVLVAGLPPAGTSACVGGYGGFGANILCDYGAIVAGRPTQFEYRYINTDVDADAETIGTFLPGTNTVYVPVGPVRVCGGDDIEHACAFDAAGVKVADVDINYSVSPPEIYNFGTVVPYSGPAYVALGSCREPVELDQVSVSESDYCVFDGTSYVGWKRREVRTVDNISGLATVTVVEWSRDGQAWSAVVPAGVVTAGACVLPSVHPEFACLKTAVTGGVVPNTFDVKRLDITTDQSLHWVFDANTGLGYPGAVPIGGPNPTPISLLNVAAVQAVLDAAFGAGHVGYAIDPNDPNSAYIYGLTASCVTDHPDLFWWGNVADYTVKDSLSDGVIAVPAADSVSYRTVEIIKTIQPSGAVSVVLVEKDGTPIVPQPALADWEPGICPKPTIYSPVDVCVRRAVDGDDWDLWMVTSVDPLTNIVTNTFYDWGVNPPLLVTDVDYSTLEFGSCCGCCDDC